MRKTRHERRVQHGKRAMRVVVEYVSRNPGSCWVKIGKGLADDYHPVPVDVLHYALRLAHKKGLLECRHPGQYTKGVRKMWYCVAPLDADDDSESPEAGRFEHRILPAGSYGRLIVSAPRSVFELGAAR